MSLGFAEVNKVGSEDAPWSMRHSQSEGFRKTVPVETAGDIIDAQEIFQKRNIDRVPLWLFKGEDLSLKARKAITIYVSHRVNNFYAENEFLNIYAIGDSYSAAIDAFKGHLIYFYQHFKALTSDEVTGEAERLKESFDQLFVENE